MPTRAAAHTTRDIATLSHNQKIVQEPFADAIEEDENQQDQGEQDLSNDSDHSSTDDSKTILAAIKDRPYTECFYCIIAKFHDYL